MRILFIRCRYEKIINQESTLASTMVICWVICCLGFQAHDMFFRFARASKSTELMFYPPFVDGKRMAGCPSYMMESKAWSREPVCFWSGQRKTLAKHMGVSKSRWVFPSNHPFVHRVFPYFHHPFWGTPIFGNTHIINK